jgi:hypothetical protein
VPNEFDTLQFIFGYRTAFDNWKLAIQNDHLPTLGVHWFEPEFYLSVFYNHSSVEKITDDAIKGFLNKLINIHAQSRLSKIEKRIRVNMEFYLLSRILPQQSFMDLIIKLKLAENDIVINEAHQNFNKNCITYIKGQLLKLGMPVAYVEKLDAWYTKQTSNPENQVTFNDIIVAGKKILNEMTNEIEKQKNQDQSDCLPTQMSMELILQMSAYLSSLYNPILKLDERAYSHSVGSFGAPI